MNKKYNVYFTMPVHFTVEVEAASTEEAEEKALEYAELSSFAGNGGWGKLVGVNESFISIEPGEGIIEGNGWSVIVEERDLFLWR